MTRDTYERLTERERIGVLLLCGRAAPSILRAIPASTFSVTECRWVAEACDMARMDGGLLDVPEVCRVLKSTPEGAKTRWDFIGGEWISQTMRGVPSRFNADMRALNQSGNFA